MFIIIVNGFGKFWLATAATESVAAQSSRKPDIAIKSPKSVTASPIATLSVVVMETILKTSAEAPAKALKPVTRSKSKKKPKAAIEPV